MQVQTCAEFSLQVPLSENGGPLVDIQQAPYINGYIDAFTYSENGNILAVTSQAAKLAPEEEFLRPFIFVFARETCVGTSRRPPVWRYIQTIHFNSKLLIPLPATRVDGTQPLSVAPFTLTVASTAGFPAAGYLYVETTLDSPQYVTYTGITPTLFLGCVADDSYTTNDGSVVQRVYDANAKFLNMSLSFDGKRLALFIFRETSSEEAIIICKVFDYSCRNNRFNDTNNDIAFHNGVYAFYEQAFAYQMSGCGQTISGFEVDFDAFVLYVTAYRINTITLKSNVVSLSINGSAALNGGYALAMSHDGLTIAVVEVQSLAFFRINLKTCQLDKIFGAGTLLPDIAFYQSAVFGGHNDNILYLFSGGDKSLRAFCKRCENGAPVWVDSGPQTMVNANRIFSLCDNESAVVADSCAYDFNCQTNTFTPQLKVSDESCTVLASAFARSTSLAHTVLCYKTDGCFKRDGWCVPELYNATHINICNDGVLSAKLVSCKGFMLVGEIPDKTCEIQVLVNGGDYEAVTLETTKLGICDASVAKTVHIKVICETCTEEYDLSVKNCYFLRCNNVEQQCLQTTTCARQRK